MWAYIMEWKGVIIVIVYGDLKGSSERLGRGLYEIADGDGYTPNFKKP